jgi:hypothetical protein
MLFRWHGRVTLRLIEVDSLLLWTVYPGDVLILSSADDLMVKRQLTSHVESPHRNSPPLRSAIRTWRKVLRVKDQAVQSQQCIVAPILLLLHPVHLLLSMLMVIQNALEMTPPSPHPV